jgi:glycosyltransferase involved in cell wall biosynthesis
MTPYPSSNDALRIAIATSGRFHVLDLARELATRGHDVRLYSSLPHSRAERFGLAREYHRSLTTLVAPVVAWQRLAPKVMPAALSWMSVRAHDAAVSAMLEPCDVFIFMSGIYLNSAQRAKERYGAKLWLERGSRHILSQDNILSTVPGATRPFRDIIARELAGYQLADRIVVPSRHVAESFAHDPESAPKLFVNPYGVSLDMFPYRERKSRAQGPLRIVFAGTWSWRKGCDVLEAAIRECKDVHLLHVGDIGDLNFPKRESMFEHLNAVPQAELTAIYHESDVFVHASREEGLSMVQVQALASGLPLICSDRTGGADLAATPALRSRITVVPHGNVTALNLAIESARDAVRVGVALPPLSHEDLHAISWQAYARRYNAELSASVRVIRPVAIQPERCRRCF